LPGLHDAVQDQGRVALSRVRAELRVTSVRPFPPLALALLLGTPAASQTLAWDVPHRGAHVYDRSTTTFEVSPPPSRLRTDHVVRGASAGGHEWRYFTCPRTGVPKDFELLAFDDSTWLLGRGEFGTEAGNDPRQRTPWRHDELCLRCHVDLGEKKPKALVFDVDHDDGIRVWLNGILVLADDGVGRGRRYVVSGDPLDAWQRGDNVLAVRCSNIHGAQYLDLAMAVVLTVPPAAKTGDDLQRLLREERDGAQRVRGDLFGGFRPPALLLQGDLDPAGSFVRIAPGDLRDLPWWVATDLRCGVLGGSVQLDAGRLYRLGDLQIKGKANPVDSEGWQTIEVAVKNTAEPALREDGKRHVERFVKPHVVYGFDGRITVRRRLEVRGNQARVVEFTTEMQGRVLRGKDWKEPAAALLQRESWTFATTRDNQDAAFRAMVQAAIEKGTKCLRGLLADVNGDDIKPNPKDTERSYQTGRLALGLLALLKGGVPRDDPVVQNALAQLRLRPLIDTYSLGNAMMAIEALYAPASEFGDLKQGTIDRPRKRTPSAEDKALLQKWTAQLLANVDTRVDPAYLLRFNYTRGDRFDNSVNQYGLLGLYSAHLCGVEISATVWEAAANHLLASQSPGGQRINLDLVDYRTHARRQSSPDEKFTVARLSGKTSGWSYEDPKSEGELVPTWGSMTSAGITGLAICQAALEDYAGLKRSKLQAEANRARNDGFAWLAQYMTMRCHAGGIERQQHWFYYYLYSLERAALLSGIALIQDRDWYFEGAMVLVLAQQADGHWPGELHADQAIERNAMAILFLKQSTLPVLTGK